MNNSFHQATQWKAREVTRRMLFMVGLAFLKIIERLHWIDREKLCGFILACQDEETGGFADRPGYMVDPFHTLFGITGLSLLGEEQIKPVSPGFCMPEVLWRVNVQPELVK